MKCMEQLERECQSFTRYLTGLTPSAYIRDKYQDFHRQSDALASLKADHFDQLLVKTAARGAGWARLADSYASRFAKGSALRKKLVLMLAILECTPPAFGELDRVPRGGAAAAILRMGLSTAGYGVCLLASFLIFAPARVWMARERRTSPVVVPEQ
jgi:hypothetical protein